MICPHCTNTNLQAVVRDGIEIDVCPRCHGMWLDHGELTRLMAAGPISALAAPIPADQYDPAVFGDEGRRSTDIKKNKSKDKKDDKKDGRPDRKSKKSKKKEKKRKQTSWSRRLGEIIEEVIDELD